MEKRNHDTHILLIEDNEADARLIKEAFKDSPAVNNFFVACDRQQALDYLEKIGSDVNHIRPDVIFLDLSLPRQDGLEVLDEIKSNPLLRSIPVVVFTGPDAGENIFNSYNLNANCCITKPAETDKFLEVVRLIESFWFRIAMLPSVN